MTAAQQTTCKLYLRGQSVRVSEREREKRETEREEQGEKKKGSMRVSLVIFSFLLFAEFSSLLLLLAVAVPSSLLSLL